MLLVSAQALASEVVNTTTKISQQALVQTAPQIPNTQDQLLQVTLGLAVVVASIYLVAWLIKRNRTLTGFSNDAIKTLAILPLGIKEKVILIEVGGKQLLLGVTPDSINTLASYDEPIVSNEKAVPVAFSKKLKEIFEQQKIPKSSDKDQ